MKAYLMATALLASGATVGFAQAPGQFKNHDQVLQQRSKQVLQPSPAERMRCDQQKELLNASSRDACRSIRRQN
jgi:hypothetical protein